MCHLVALRSARLCAAGIAGVLKHMGRACTDDQQPGEDVVVAVDGSLFAKYTTYRQVGLARLRRLALLQACRRRACKAACLQGAERLPRLRRQYVQAALVELCGQQAAARIRLQLAMDGSVLGAAFVAVAADQFG